MVYRSKQEKVESQCIGFIICAAIVGGILGYNAFMSFARTNPYVIPITIGIVILIIVGIFCWCLRGKDESSTSIDLPTDPYQ